MLALVLHLIGAAVASAAGQLLVQHYFPAQATHPVVFIALIVLGGAVAWSDRWFPRLLKEFGWKPRRLGARIHSSWQDTEDRSGSPTDPHVLFLYEIINAERRNIRVVGVTGRTSIDGVGLGGGFEVESEVPPIIVQGSRETIQLRLSLSPEQAVAVQQVKARRGEGNTEFNFVGGVRLLIKEEKSGEESKVQLSNPKL